MAEMLVQSESLTAVADAIREKAGTTDRMVFPDDFVEKIGGLGTDGDFVFVLFDDTTLTGEEVRIMDIPQGMVMKIQNTNGKTLWESALSALDPVLDNNSWEMIANAARAGLASAIWSVGDCKAVTINGTVGTQTVNTTLYAYIIGFDHRGATGTIDFGTFKTAKIGGVDVSLGEPYYAKTSTNGTKYYNMNHSVASNSGGWQECDLRYDILGSTDVKNADASATTATSPVANTLMSALPADLRAVMKPMTIYTDNEGTGYGFAACVWATIDYLPLLAPFEIFGQSTPSYINDAEKDYQDQYAYYVAGNSALKYQQIATTEARFWWTRSPHLYNNADGKNFCAVATGGNLQYSQAIYSEGLAPIFRV